MLVAFILICVTAIADDFIKMFASDFAAIEGIVTIALLSLLERVTLDVELEPPPPAPPAPPPLEELLDESELLDPVTVIDLDGDALPPASETTFTVTLHVPDDDEAVIFQFSDDLLVPFVIFPRLCCAATYEVSTVHWPDSLIVARALDTSLADGAVTVTPR